MEITEQLIEELFQAMREGRETDAPDELRRFYRLYKNAPRGVLDDTEDVIKPWIRMPLFRPAAVEILNRRRRSNGKITAPNRTVFSDNIYAEVSRNLPYLEDINLGSLQLLRALVARGIKGEEISDIIKTLEGVCNGEPLIGMELYPYTISDVEDFDVRGGARVLNLLRGIGSRRIRGAITMYSWTDNSISEC